MQMIAICGKPLWASMTHRVRLDRVFLTMKYLLALLLVISLNVHANANAQRITIVVKNASLKKVITSIEQQSGIVFFYDAELLTKANNNITLNISDASLESALEICFRNQPFSYSLVGKTVVLTLKQTKAAVADTLIRLVHGGVADEKYQPIPGVTVHVKGTNNGTTTDVGGDFFLRNVPENATLVFTSINMKPLEVKLNGREDLTIVMKENVTSLSNITVTANTGYQQIPKERATGSFEVVDSSLFNRVTGTNILPRLEGVVPGLLFDKRVASDGRLSTISIRGISTLTDNLTSPLVILDNFPYDGDINNINPNDVESITVLKDAAAASIWGARAGNGVIVITTKKSHYDRTPQLTFNSNVTLVQKPDLFYFKQMKSSDYIDVEKMVFNNGGYDNAFSDVYTWPYLSPVVELMEQAKEGAITQADADAQIDALRKYDVRNDLLKYIYRQAVQQQYALSLKGGGEDFNYLFSGGYDNDRLGKVTTDDERITFRSEFSYKPLKKLELQGGLFYTKTNSYPGLDLPDYSMSAYLPYTRFADANGNPLVVGMTHRQPFLDTIGGGNLLDWHYRPLAELHAGSNTTTNTAMLMRASARYQLNDVFSGEVRYQYSQTLSDIRTLHSQDSYYARNLINMFTQLNGSTIVAQPVPVGGILYQDNGETDAYNLRGQINANKTWNNIHQLAAIVGAEVRETRNKEHASTVYGYNDNLLTYQNVDFATVYPTMFYDYTNIPSNINFTDQVYRFTSLFANASYTYRSRYILSGSARKDASNLFGVKTNQKGVPLWSAGVSWLIGQESFYKSSVLPFLKLRATYGYAGNTDNNLSAYSVIQYLNYPALYTGLPQAYILTPANENLRWEKVGTLNLGADFGFKDDRLTGSVEYYVKNVKDALSLIPIDYTTGFTAVSTNNAALRGKGIDVQLHSRNLTGALSWNTDFIFSYTTNKVTHFVTPNIVSGSDVISKGYFITPVEGKPAYTIFSYKWAGLDPQNGDPRGFDTKGNVSKDYATLLSTGVNDLQYNGSAVPVYFGSLRNTFQWKKFSLSANIIYKLGYYFRRSSISYSALFNTNLGTPIGIGHADYALRWQKPGDEKHTDVPSMVYPADNLRDEFYSKSATLVSKADHIRLQDVTFGYTLDKSNWRFRNIRFYGNVTNIGIIWRANKQHIDPDYGDAFPAPLTMALGVSTNF
jgi:TonB-dependent starch-binding outer membrane protein SusC